MTSPDRRPSAGFLRRWLSGLTGAWFIPAGKKRRRAGSVLGRRQRGLLTLLWLLGLFMLANTLFLALNHVAETVSWAWLARPPLKLPAFFQVMVLSHTGVGLVAALIFVVFGVWHLPAVWRRRRRRTFWSGILAYIAGAVLTLTGLFIVQEANSRAHFLIWLAHVSASLLLIGAYGFHRWSSVRQPSAAASRGTVFGVSLLLATIFILHWIGIRRTAYQTQAGMSSGFAHLDELGRVSPASPFFPSPAMTASGGFIGDDFLVPGDHDRFGEEVRRETLNSGFVRDTLLGAQDCRRCHPDTVEQWSVSAHRFASFNNPFYEATIMDLRENGGKGNEWIDRHAAELGMEPPAGDGYVKSRWCAGCHDPALLFAGALEMAGAPDRSDVRSQAGLTCLACHAIDDLHGTTGNGAYVLDDLTRDPYLFPQADARLLQFIHDTALKAKPSVHKANMLKPFFQTSEFCSVCHKVSLDEPVNNYRWLRGQNEYDAWHDSGVARNAARTFYLPGEAKSCQDCHMPMEPAPLGDVAAKNGMIRSHRFLSVNTALPSLRGDSESIGRLEADLRDAKMSLDIFAVRSGGDLLWGMDSVAMEPGQEVQFDLVVRNRGVGHTFPGGTNDSNEGWIEWTITDPAGEILAESGRVREDGHVDPEAHFYRSVMLTENSQRVAHRDAQNARTFAYSSVIGPGTADVVRYVWRVPDDWSTRVIQVNARLLWRKFNQDYTEFAYSRNPDGFVAYADVPELPITEIARTGMELTISHNDDHRPGAPNDSVLAREEWSRLNDYGIGLLLQGDTHAAGAVFEELSKLAPERVDGFRNSARVSIIDGNLENAYRWLRMCEEISPGDPQTAYFWGLALQEDGRYEAASSAYLRTLSTFPADRDTWRRLGRTYYLDGRYLEALEAMDAVLSIDSEDRIAHYHKFLIYQALGDVMLASGAEHGYRRYQIDESAQKLALEYLRSHPADNQEAQEIHQHVLHPAQSKRINK